MSISTRSKFYFGHTITADNQNLDFKEGAGSELTAVLEIGTYSLEEFAAEIERAMTVAGTFVYTVTVNRTTRVITIAADSAITLLGATGTHIGTGVFSLAGFAASDTGSATSHVGGSASGSSYATQFVPQDYIAPDDWQAATDGVVNKSASGRIEVVRFGTETFFQMNLKYITSVALGSGSPIRYSATGLADARTFMQYLTTKARVEFMPDEDTPGTYSTVILESTPDDKNGLAYMLKEMIGQHLPGFFETGKLKFRVVT